MNRRKAALASSLLAVLFVGACAQVDGGQEAGKGSRMASSLTALIQMDLDQQELSTANRALLEQAAQEGEISSSVYEQAAREYQRCVADLGNDVRWDKMPDGSYAEVPLADAEAELDKYWEDSGACAADGFSAIQSLYSVQQNNPNLYSDEYEAVFSCLETADKVPADMNLGDFRVKLEDMYGGGKFVELDIDDPDIRMCLQGNGFGVAR